MKRLYLLPFALTLGGCNLGLMERNFVSRAETIPVTAAPATVGTIPVGTGSQEDDTAAQARAIAALVLPEGAGKITKIREKHFANGTRQEIIIAADKGTYGENVIDVSIRTKTADARSPNPLMIGPPSENGIRTEILSRFPDVQMNIVTRPMRNGLGPFGLAIGRHAGGSRCVFIWQWIEDLRETSTGSNLTKLNALMAGRSLATSVRIRLCRNDSTVDQIASQIEGLRVGSTGALERIAGMDRRDIDGDTIAVSGGSRATPLVRPVSGSLEAAITRPARREAAPQQVARAKPKPARQAQPRRIVRQEPRPEPARPAPQPVYAQPPAQAAPAGAYGQRFLAPVAGAAPPPAYAAAPGAPGPGSGIALPPQAYRGPGM